MKKKRVYTEEEISKRKDKIRYFIKLTATIILVISIVVGFITLIYFSATYMPNNPIGSVEIYNFDGTVETREFLKYKHGDGYFSFYFEGDENKYTYPKDRVIIMLYN